MHMDSICMRSLRALCWRNWRQGYGESYSKLLGKSGLGDLAPGGALVAPIVSGPREGLMRTSTGQRLDQYW